MDFQKKIHNIFSVFSFSVLFLNSAAFKVFRNHQQKYFFTFLQCRGVGESLLAFHIDLLCVLYNLMAWLAYVSSIYTTTCRSITPLARSTGELLGTSLWWTEHKCAPVKWLVTVQKHTFPFKMRERAENKNPCRGSLRKGLPLPESGANFMTINRNVEWLKTQMKSSLFSYNCCTGSWNWSHEVGKILYRFPEILHILDNCVSLD